MKKLILGIVCLFTSLHAVDYYGSDIYPDNRYLNPNANANPMYRPNPYPGQPAYRSYQGYSSTGYISNYPRGYSSQNFYSTYPGAGSTYNTSSGVPLYGPAGGTQYNSTYNTSSGAPMYNIGGSNYGAPGTLR